MGGERSSVNYVKVLKICLKTIWSASYISDPLSNQNFIHQHTKKPFFPSVPEKAKLIAQHGLWNFLPHTRTEFCVSYRWFLSGQSTVAGTAAVRTCTGAMPVAASSSAAPTPPSLLASSLWNPLSLGFQRRGILDGVTWKKRHMVFISHVTKYQFLAIDKSQAT